MTADHTVPCERPENDPDDWFIEKDGRQYPDDDLLSHEEHQRIADEVLAEHGDGDGIFEAVEEAIDAAEAEAVRGALQRRRHAKDKCFTECMFRLQCLTIALDRPYPTHGIWGGYYPEELRQIRNVRRRPSHDADVVREE